MRRIWARYQECKIQKFVGSALKSKSVDDGKRDIFFMVPKPRLYIHIITVTEHPNTHNVSPRRTAITDNCIGLWFRTTASYPGWLCRTTPDYAGLLSAYFELRRTTSGQLGRPDTGVLGTRPEGQPGPRGNYLLDFLSPLCRFSLHLRLAD